MSCSQPSLENRKDLRSFQYYTVGNKLKFCLVEDAILNLIAVSRMRKSLSYVFGLTSAWTCKTKHLERRQVPLVRSPNGHKIYWYIKEIPRDILDFFSRIYGNVFSPFNEIFGSRPSG